jgi:hypothetical protein
MNVKRLLIAGIAGVAFTVPAVSALASEGARPTTTDHPKRATGLVGEVRAATRDFRDARNASNGGYTSLGSCVSGPEQGAMGVHFINEDLLNDPTLKADQPELLVYEQRGGKLRLVAAEYLVIAEAWHAANPGPPVLDGQHFHYVGSPNRYGLPPFYELHVWSWKDNRFGEFVDFNPAVSCAQYTGEEVGAHAGH